MITRTNQLKINTRLFRLHFWWGCSKTRLDYQLQFGKMSPLSEPERAAEIEPRVRLESIVLF